MGKFYFIPGTYIPNTAATNRWLAYLKFFSKNGIDTTVVFFRSDENRDVLNETDNIRVLNLWRKYSTKFTISFYVCLLLEYCKFWFKLKSGDVVYCYEQANLWRFFMKKGVRLYSEYTEHPDIIGYGGSVFKISKRSFLKKCNKLSGLFVISTPLKELFLYYGMPKDKVHIANMIVDCDRFNGCEKNITEKPYMAYCGSISKSKDGVDDLIRSFSIFHKAFPQEMLYLIGSSSSKTELNELKKLTDELNISEYVIFTGTINSNQIPQYLINADLLLLDRPNNKQAKYGFPTKLGEYLLSGTPVVVTDVGDVSVFLTDGVNAFVAKSSDPETFAEKMVLAFEDYKRSSAIGQKGKEMAIENFSSEKVSRFMVSIMFSNNYQSVN